MNLIIASGGLSLSLSLSLSQVQGYDGCSRTPEAHLVAPERCPRGIFEAVVEVVVEEVDVLWMTIFHKIRKLLYRASKCTLPKASVNGNLRDLLERKYFIIIQRVP